MQHSNKPNKKQVRRIEQRIVQVLKAARRKVGDNFEIPIDNSAIRNRIRRIWGNFLPIHEERDKLIEVQIVHETINRAFDEASDELDKFLTEFFRPACADECCTPEHGPVVAPEANAFFLETEGPTLNLPESTLHVVGGVLTDKRTGLTARMWYSDGTEVVVIPRYAFLRQQAGITKLENQWATQKKNLEFLLKEKADDESALDEVEKNLVKLGDALKHRDQYLDSICVALGPRAFKDEQGNSMTEPQHDRILHCITRIILSHRRQSEEIRVLRQQRKDYLANGVNHE